jgi:hypothetical protein
MTQYIIKAWLLLLLVEYITRFRGFNALHMAVKNQKLCPNRRDAAPSIETLIVAMDYACVFYFKPVLCLQRSAATAVQLRHHGHNAEMVIGVQLLPFKSHAWVEVGPNIVNDKPYVRDIYQTLDRC